MKLSYSAVNSYKLCPTKFKLQKKYRVPLNSAALPFGASVEDGVSVLLKGGTLAHAFLAFKNSWHTRPANQWSESQQIFDSKDVFYYLKDYDLELLTEADERFIASLWSPQWEQLVEEVYGKIKAGQHVDTESKKLYNRVVWLCCRRRGLLMIKTFYQEILPKIKKVHAIQKPIQINNEEDDSVTGIIDFILEFEGYEGRIIFDLKTAGSFYELHQLETSDQLRTYCAAEGISKAGYLVLNKTIQFEYACKVCGKQKPSGSKARNCVDKGCKGSYTKANPRASYQILVTQFLSDKLQETMDEYSDILAAVKNEIFWKNPASCFSYGTRCEYYEVCWLGKSLDDLKKENEKKD